MNHEPDPGRRNSDDRKATPPSESPPSRGHAGHSHSHVEHSHSHAGHGHTHSAHGHSRSRHNHSHSGHSHSHAGHGHVHGGGSGNKRGLLIAFLITTGIMVLEFFGGLVTGSLALLSDSGHMLSDAGALLLSLVAISVAARPASPKRTFGFRRFEILAALFNGATLIAIAIFILVEAWGRFWEPPTVASRSMLLIAAVGLLANLASAWFLMRQGDVKGNVNLKSAYLHVLGDALGSVGAIAAGALMWAFGWYWADPAISVFVSLLIVKSAWGMLRSTVHILMEGAPETVDTQQVRDDLEALPGVIDVHDLHIWTITSGLDAMTCHLLADEQADHRLLLKQAIELMKDRHGISHCTIQIEDSSVRHDELGC
ncbi:cation transporter [Paenibacillus albicereus]|uniref:Cation transporter n=1 Tax=Paenibacillus albicereus TaxID=2726185 RepID=A0A6H2GSY4_9BACL|nr:cation diffusion facilitator family transporter [Paenibacillus albicereus]QJC50534.1 cation transporter [Paenibacillus albicereus]